MNESIKKMRGYLDKTYKDDGYKHYVSWKDMTEDFVQRISTGSILLDDLLGSGFVRGSISTYFGGEGGGKSTLVSFIAAAHQRAGLPVLYIDAENKFQPEYVLNTTGFNVMDEETVLFSQEENASVVYDMILNAADMGFGLAIVDSADALMTDSQQEAAMGEAQMMQHARMHSESLRKIKGACNRAKMSVIFIQQARTFMIPGGGSYEEASGGKAIKFYSLTRNKVRRVKVIEDKETGEASGVVIEVKNVKNQGGIPFKTAELTILFNKGFDTFNETIELAIKYGVITKSGGWFTYPAFGGKPIQGKDRVIEWFREKPEEYQILNNQTQQAMRELNRKTGNTVYNAESDNVEDIEEVEEKKTRRGKK